MALNKRYERGQKISFAVPVGTTSGEAVAVGAEGLCGVAVVDRQPDGEATIDFEGVYDLPVVAAGAMAVGDEVTIAVATGVLSGTAVGAGQVKFGYLLEAIAGASTVTRPVKLER